MSVSLCSSHVLWFSGNEHVPAGWSTSVKGARIQFRQQEQNMTVSLYLSANSRF
jgi:hypothetical protein